MLNIQQRKVFRQKELDIAFSFRQQAVGNRDGGDEDVPEDEVDPLRDERGARGFADEEDEECGVGLSAPQEMTPLEDQYVAVL